jgi:hypothetical protein
MHLRLCAEAAKPIPCPNWLTLNLPFTNAGLWPGRAKAEFKLAAVNQSSKAGQFGKF